MNIRFKYSAAVVEKLKYKHNVYDDEISQCFYNRTLGFLLDTRTEHITTPSTWWFISETDTGRKLLIAFIQHSNSVVEIKTAFEPSPSRVTFYEQNAI